MLDHNQNKRVNNNIKIAAILMCSVIISGVSYMHHTMRPKDDAITAYAEDSEKEFKWTKCAVEDGTTVNASYLWPNETNPSFTDIYRNGERLVDDKMITVTSGSVYHFMGKSDESVLYTEVYVGILSDMDITSKDADTWYCLLPSSIRERFEADGWTWETGWEYTGRAYLDFENNRILIKTDDPTAVLYGIGLYLDNKYNYTDDEAFIQEGMDFTNTFGNVENLFAQALEYYYTREGELHSVCPEIYDKVTNVLSGQNTKIVDIIPDTSQTENENDTHSSESILMTDMLEYINNKRIEAGLSSVLWDTDDDENIAVRAKEVSVVYSQTRPDGTDAFSAYTDAVMCEMRFDDITDMETIFDHASKYFLMENLVSFNCAAYDNVIVLVFVW